MERKMFVAIIILAAVSWSLAGQAVDGVVESNEYPASAEFDDGRYRLQWRLEGDTVYFALSVATGGWVAIGFEPKTVMAEADMIFGWVDDTGKTHFVDAYSQGTFGPHPPDTELGGSMDILEAVGTQTGGVTVFEFSRKILTGDKFDKAIPKDGDVKFIWAYGDSDEFEQFHVMAGYGFINMATGVGVPTIIRDLIPLHIVVTSIAFLLMTGGMLISRYMKKKRWWLKAHRPMGIVGSVLGVIGVSMASVTLYFSGSVHLRVLHSWIGLFTISLIVLTPILGQAFLKLKWHKQDLRKLHRWIGRLALSMMLVTMIVGINLSGIL
ncbi:MAG TPA: cytochrome and DOMON domain-containing protein [Spirochaetia bacterium]|nr:cytochrome and DOMON domain-containing protein [Spirochaetia bacterium]